jgi:catechol 2,3-dioxygenase-like lactoylglutathione lyase family enzyme
MQPRVDHIAFVVKDLERSVAFYRDVFGGEVGRSRGFNEKDKSAGRPVHTLVKVGDYGFDLFVQDPNDPPHPRARYLHFAFNIRPDEVDAALEKLKKLNIPFDGPKVHGGSTSISVYFSDPDGYQLEFSAKFPDAESHKKAMARLGATYGGAGTKTYEWKADA